jgi:DNA polymerase V
MSHIFALADADSFYASCERALNPALRRRPVVVLSNNDGCIVSHTDEVKALNIRKGVPLFQVQRLLEKHNAAILSSNYALYGDISERIMESLREFTPEVEIYSIDEAFLDLEGCRSMSLQELGREIQGKIYQWTGIPITLGIAETKTLAKVATHIAKRSPKAAGVLDLYKSPYQELALERTSVGKVWGIGQQYEKKLLANEIMTALALRDANTGWIRKNLTINVHRLVMELRGISCIELETCPPPRKSVTCSRTFGVAVERLSEVREALAVYVTRAAEKLRRDRLAASALTVSIHTDRFALGPQDNPSATRALTYPTDSTNELLAYALDTLEGLFREGCRYRKARVTFFGLVPAEQLTLRLFDDTRRERSRRVMEAVDLINRKYGKDTVRFAVAQPDGRWKTKFERCSPHYTTRLTDVPTVH